MLNKDYNFDEFESISREQWLEKATIDLKGKSLDSLDWQLDGNTHTPFYTQGDISGIPSFVIDKSSSWLNLQHFNASGHNFEKECLEALNNGADGLIIDFDTEKSIKEKFKDILPEHCHLSISSNDNSSEISKEYFSYLDGVSTEGTEIKGLGFWNDIVRVSPTDKSFSFLTGTAVDIISNSKHVGFRNLLIDTERLSASSGTLLSKEIGMSLSLMVLLINELLNKGLKFDQVVSNIFFRLKSRKEYFAEIAKTRAYRILVREIIGLYDQKTTMFPHFHMDISSKGEYNYLASTTEAMSSIIGGVDSLSIVPEEVNKLNVRMARNVSNIIKEESYLDKSQDTAAGSFFIESLTFEMVRDSWNTFTDIEREGGFEKAIKNGYLKSII